jgi:hypothetical protein
MAIPQSSTLWHQVKKYATEIAVSFLDGFLRGGGITPTQKELVPSQQAVGAQLAGTAGEIVGATAKAGVGAASCLLRLWAILLGVFIVTLMMWAAPPLGLIALVVLIWLTIRSFISRSQRKSKGIWY